MASWSNHAVDRAGRYFLSLSLAPPFPTPPLRRENGDDAVEPTELRTCLHGLGVEISLGEATAMIMMADSEGKGTMSKDDFLAMMVKRLRGSLNSNGDRPALPGDGAPTVKNGGLNGGPGWQLWWRGGWLAQVGDSDVLRGEARRKKDSTPPWEDTHPRGAS